MPKPFLTIVEVAERLSLTPGRCYQLARAGELPVTRVGGRLRVPTAAFDEWVRRKAERALATTQHPSSKGKGMRCSEGFRG